MLKNYRIRSKPAPAGIFKGGEQMNMEKPVINATVPGADIVL